MRRTLTAFAAFGAFAALPLTSKAQTLFLEYEGTVDTVQSSPYWSYKPGDRVKGVVKIYPSLAPPDRRPAPDWADYVTGGPTNNFVVSKFGIGNRNEDAMHIQVGSLGQEDRYWLSDISSIEGSLDLDRDYHYFQLRVTGRDLLQGDGIVQTFDARPAKDGSSILAAFMQGVGQFRRTVTFALSRVSVTPGMCRP